jgi:hypothetical protein
MKGIPRRETCGREQNRLRTFDAEKIDGKHLVDDSQKRLERRLDRVETLDGRIAMKELLEYLGVSHQTLTLGSEPFEKSLCVGLVRMGRSDEVHGHIRIDEDHR